MKNKIFKTIIVLIIGLLLGSCYMMNEPATGDLSMSMNLPARAEGDTEEKWVVGLVVDAAYENDLINLMRLIDRSDFYGEGDILTNPYYDQVKGDLFEDEAETILEDMLQKGAVRFDGGRFFFQFKLEDAGAAGDFTITGIPADKEYFLYILVFKQKISSIDDFGEETYESDAYMQMRYFDANYYDIGDVPDLGTLNKGWYYFHDWDYSESFDGVPTLNNADIWIKNGSVSPITNQPFLVKPGEATTIEILLTEDIIPEV